MKLFDTNENSCKDKRCEHEWRVYGTRINEEVYEPIRYDGKPAGYYGGWIICTKCELWPPAVARYEIVGERDYECPLLGKWRDLIVKVTDWGK